MKSLFSTLKRAFRWGQSAGAISVGLHMLYNGGNTEGLFRGAFMQSGFPMSVGGLEQGQVSYDFVVQQVGCSKAADTLECLRKAPYDALRDAFLATPGPSSYHVRSISLGWQPTVADTIFFKSVAETYLPRVDGVFLTDNPQKLVLHGQVAEIQFIAGSYCLCFLLKSGL